MSGYAPGNYAIRCHKCGEHKHGMDKRAITCKECAMERDGYAILVRGNIVAWFQDFDDWAAEWCTNNHFGAWLIMKARQPVIVAPSKEAVESAEKSAAELSEILNDISQGEPLGEEFEAVLDSAKGELYEE